MAKAVRQLAMIWVILLLTHGFSQAGPAAPSSVRTVEAALTGKPPSGPHRVIVEHDTGLATHTIYRPEPFGPQRYPVLLWGNGACEKYGLRFAEFLVEIASHGIFIIADGPPVPPETPPQRPGPGTLKPDGSALLKALDWIDGENRRAGSRYEDKIDMHHVAAMGMSCGGLQAYGASGDPRVTSVGIWNSGLLEPNAPIFAGLHSPVIIVTGGTQDIAYANGLRDFNTMPEKIPVVHAVYPGTGHGGTYADDNGGPFGTVAVAWLKWTLSGDQSAGSRGLFTGEICGLCGDAAWSVQRRGMQ